MVVAAVVPTADDEIVLLEPEKRFLTAPTGEGRAAVEHDCRSGVESRDRESSARKG